MVSGQYFFSWANWKNGRSNSAQCSGVSMMSVKCKENQEADYSAAACVCGAGSLKAAMACLTP
jgi:hypothetical protein